MPQQDKHSKTEDATPKRIRDSKKKGQVSKSQDLVSSVSFLAFALLLGSLGTYLLKNSMDFMGLALTYDVGSGLTPKFVGTLLVQNVMKVLLIFFPFGLIAVILGVVVNVVQVGFLFTMEPLKPDFKKLNPIEGFKNIF
ncbi:MAG TPA: EscU/YscU/HrcU family type III secretion system export apparatus switch protein, partial [Proteiniclasticum sp.]|nr:EscU/YscU/HrcU family type III secretion system export apparatus switch protein [Proteiniclasticum sp.]